VRAHAALLPWGIAAVLLAAACTTGSTHVEPAPAKTAAPDAAAPKRRSALVVALVIDQLPMWIAEERWKTLPPSGGFAKLLGEANAALELRHGHAFNATAPGHAALFTGGTASATGITANGKLSPEGQYASVLADSTTKLVSASGPEDRSSSSLAALKSDTVADGLKHARGDARVVSLSMKDRGALFGAGRKPDAVFWFDASLDALVTSTAFADATPAWAATFTAPGSGARYRQAPWVPADPKWLAQHTDLPAPDLGQGDFNGLGVRFPHDLSKLPKAAKAFVSTPFADTMLIDAAVAAIDELAREDKPALLAVSLSATDYVGHMFGPDAPESWDQLARLDAELLRLLSHLDQRLGSDGYAVVMSADHGVPPTPEVMNQGFCGRPDADRFERRCERALRLHGAELTKIAEYAADKAAGPGDYFLGQTEPFLILRGTARSLPTGKLETAVGAAIQALSATAGVARAVDVRKIPAQCPPLSDESLDALVCRSIRGSTGGDIFVVPKPGAFVDAMYVEGDGVNHGTPYLFDRAVPLVVRAPRPAGAARAGEAPALDGKNVVDHRAYAVTLSALLGIEPPEAAVGGKDLSKVVIR
jgi:hypothetical protein